MKKPLDYKENCKLLGITSDDTIETLKIKFRVLAKQYHPDSETGDEEMFKKIADAYYFVLKHFTEITLELKASDLLEDLLVKQGGFQTEKRLKRGSTLDVSLNLSLTTQQISDEHKLTIAYSKRVSCVKCTEGCTFCKKTTVATEDVIMQLKLSPYMFNKDGNLVYKGLGDKINKFPTGDLIITPTYMDEFSTRMVDDVPVMVVEKEVKWHNKGDKIKLLTSLGHIEVQLPDAIEDGTEVKVKEKGYYFSKEKKTGDLIVILKL